MKTGGLMNLMWYISCEGQLQCPKGCGPLETLVISQNKENFGRKHVTWHLWCLASGHETLPYSRISNSIEFNLFCSRKPYLVIQPPHNVEQVNNYVLIYASVWSSILDSIQMPQSIISIWRLFAVTVQTISVIYMQVSICDLTYFASLPQQ
jgi:hypothetical protein